MAIFAWLVVALLGLCLLVLLMPWHLRFTGRTSPRSARLELRLLAGAAPAIPIPLGRKRRKDREKKPKKDRKARRHHRGIPKGIAGLIRGILAAFRLRELRIAGRIGLDDPADTGQLWAVIVPVAHTLSGPRRRIDLTPEFSGPCLDLEASGEIAIRPTRLLQAGATFAWANWRAT